MKFSMIVLNPSWLSKCLSLNFLMHELISISQDGEQWIEGTSLPNQTEQQLQILQPNLLKTQKIKQQQNESYKSSSWRGLKLSGVNACIYPSFPTQNDIGLNWTHMVETTSKACGLNEKLAFVLQNNCLWCPSDFEGYMTVSRRSSPINEQNSVLFTTGNLNRPGLSC